MLVIWLPGGYVTPTWANLHAATDAARGSCSAGSDRGGRGHGRRAARRCATRRDRGSACAGPSERDCGGRRGRRTRRGDATRG
eukprot:36578-Chlamydomonas_euryale.AAC.1